MNAPENLKASGPSQNSAPNAPHSGQSVDRAGGSSRGPFLAWAAAALALFAVCIAGWVYAPVRPEPFEKPPPPLSLDWWIYAPADPGIADLDMVPVGSFGSFLPREIAANIRAKAPFTINGIADVYVQPDGKELVLSLYDPSPSPGRDAIVQHSPDGGKTWRDAPGEKPEPCAVPGQRLKIQWFEPGPKNVAIDCFPTSLPSSLHSGSATTSVLFRTGTKGDGVWLTETGPVWIVIGEATRLKLPNKEPPTLVRPHSENRILVASPDGFITLTPQRSGGPPILGVAPTFGTVPSVGNEGPASPKGIGSAAIPPNIAAPPNLGITPGAFNRAQTADRERAQIQQRGLEQKAPPLLPPPLPLPEQKAAPPRPAPPPIRSELILPVVSPLTSFGDPQHPDRNAPILTMRVSNDGKSIVVAQDVARDTGVLVSHDAGQSWSRLGYVTGAPPWIVFIAFPFAVMATAAAARQLIRTPAGEPSIADEAATDRPIGLYDVDALQFAPIARGLLMFIRNPQTEPPVTIAVTGPWGSGKTSLMNILRDLLREHDARPVWFNAWHHQKEEHLLAALIENIRQQAIPSIGTWAGLFFRLRLLRRRFVGRLGVLLVLLAATLFFVGSYLSLSEQTTKELRTSLLHTYQSATDKKPGLPAEHDDTAGKGQKAEGDWLLALTALLPSSLAIPALLFGILKNLQAFPRAKPEQLLGASNNKGDFAGKLSFRYRFEREFRETAAALRSPTSPGLVIFIDDLDRCQSQNVVELLEAINFIVSAGECFIIVGMARDQVRRSILASYKSEFLALPKEAVRGGDIEAARRRFADRYLEKLINIEVPVPQASVDQIKALLTGTAKRPDLPPGVAVRRQLRFVYDNGPVILLAGFLVALFVWVQPYVARLSLHRSGPPPIADTTPANPNNLPAGPVADFTVPQVYASDKDLAAAAPRAGFPWAQLALALALLAAAGAYLARLWVLSKQRPASDSQPFRDALGLWNSVIFLASRTPRAVKQYKNMLRYQAMRLRALQATGEASADIREPDLVALGAISLVDPKLLTGAVLPDRPIESLVKDAAVQASLDDQAVLKAISASLDERKRTIGQATASGALEVSISQYLALLPAAG
jgi:hypothetical protein